MASVRENPSSPLYGLIGGTAIAPKTSANTLIVATIVIAALYIGRSIIMPIALAVLLAFVLTPMVRFLRRRIKLPTVLSVLLIVGLCFGLLVAAGFMVAKQVSTLAENIPRYEYSLREKVKTLRGAAMRSAAMEQAAETIKGLGEELSKTEQRARPEATPTNPNEAKNEASEKPLRVMVLKPPPTALETYGRLIGTLVEPLAMIGLVFLFLTFILIQRQDLRDRIIRLAGERDLERTTSAMTEAGERLSRFFALQLVLNTGYGVIVGFALWAIGVPNPILWAGLAFLMRYVPYIGSVLAAVFPLILAAAVDPTWTTFFWTLGLYIAGESLMGQVVEPMAFGSNTGLSPFAVIISATLWTSLWGPLGLVLAVPLTLVLVTMSRHVDHLSFLNVMFGDEPALGSIERFYQRTLANDPVEATELAEEYVKERSLLTFYDDVALGALRLAQKDAERGALGEEKLDTIVDTVRQVSDDLSFVDDATEIDVKTALKRTAGDGGGDLDAAVSQDVIPVLDAHQLDAEWQTKHPVICVSGRSPLDAAAADLMCHLLQTHGIGAEHRPFTDFSSSKLETVNLTDTQVVIISYLGLGKRTAHIRSLIKRVRRACPASTIVAGVWNNINEDDQQAVDLEIGADHTIHAMRSGLELCVNQALNET